MFDNPDIFACVVDMLPASALLAIACTSKLLAAQTKYYLSAVHRVRHALNTHRLQLDHWLFVHDTHGKTAPLAGSVSDMPDHGHRHGPIISMLRQAAYVQSTAAVYAYYLAQQSPAGFARLCQHLPEPSQHDWLRRCRERGTAALCSRQYVCMVPGFTLPAALHGTHITTRTIELLKLHVFAEYPGYRNLYAPDQYVRRLAVCTMQSVRDETTATTKCVLVLDMAGGRPVYDVYKLMRSVLLLESQVHADADGWCRRACIAL